MKTTEVIRNEEWKYYSNMIMLVFKGGGPDVGLTLCGLF